MRFLMLVFLLGYLPLNLNCQEYLLKNPSREIVIHVGDTVVKTKILVANENLSLDIAKPYYWYGNGNIFSNYGACGGLMLHGPYNVFLSGRLIAAGKFEKGLKEGNWVMWDMSGTVIESVLWRKGVLARNRKSENQPAEGKPGKGFRLKKIERTKKKPLNS
jgi:antitoxin component YwqK of YwqJK toxin-antitoxin module